MSADVRSDGAIRIWTMVSHNRHNERIMCMDDDGNRHPLTRPALILNEDPDKRSHRQYHRWRMEVKPNTKCDCYSCTNPDL